MKLQTSLLLTSLSLPGALSGFLGPIYPAPRDLSSRNSHVAASWRNLSASLDNALHRSNNTLSKLRDTTFSIGLFSTRDAGAETLQYHYASPEIVQAKNGTHKVDGDSIYRVASVSKLFTVLAALVELDGQDWELPLSAIFPEFAQYLREHSDTLDPVYDNQWDAITPKALASHMGGIAQYGAPWIGDLYLSNQILNTSLPDIGLPPIGENDRFSLPPCATLEGLAGACSPGDYAEGVAGSAPIFLPWASPVYSNNGLTLLGAAIANLTGKSLDQVFQDSVFDPLDLNSTYSVIPPKSELHRSVVAGPFEAGFGLENGISKSSGGIFSTLNDLAKFGTGILNSTLLSPTETRRWMKPVSHTSSLHISIGAPWEIYRYEHPGTGLVTDIYTKLGDSGSYGGLTAILPDFDAGFSVITASTADTRSENTFFLIQQIVDAILPALTKQAGVELERKYVGTYTSTTPGLNSSITFKAVGGALPGLQISSWVSNGTDLSPQIKTLFRSPGFQQPYSLRPAISPAGDAGKIVFRPATAVVKPIEPRDPSNLFTSFYYADDWAFLGQTSYALQYLSEFVFDINKDGSVGSVTIPAWRVELEKQ
ncbi:hypothetical protein ASPVEDRAFT_40260 [Aspergillus versicolor CBS 583.65]|uniref:Uncharacterized protein n=1 Tax=Aspergillus versicolor CBS 583.65 TaxID=1036611 RepID=A0A1L9PGS1_ASPVE|nr:uncharacterized protein ASPVEDRAFT_40260 [Aspergillus versicolor CBS 583.65]OJJ00727.1 hypothetical protein ASPVEDRAFT_40260 [Aspergillus versicolor CBS 583.65]